MTDTPIVSVDYVACACHSYNKRCVCMATPDSKQELCEQCRQGDHVDINGKKFFD